MWKCGDVRPLGLLSSFGVVLRTLSLPLQINCRASSSKFTEEGQRSSSVVEHLPSLHIRPDVVSIVCVCVCVCICPSVWCVCVHMSISVCIHECVHVCVHMSSVCVSMSVLVCVCVWVCAYVCPCICVWEALRLELRWTCSFNWKELPSWQ